MATHTYRIEQLYEDQHPDFVLDAVPAVLAWLADVQGEGPEYAYSVGVQRQSMEAPAEESLVLSWDFQQLARRDGSLRQRVRRMRSGRTPHREHVTEVAAYGLALVAISVFLPGQRVVAWAKHVAPDLLLDATPTARRGVEVAGRARGGRPALRAIAEGSESVPGKTLLLREDPEIAEAWLSLWCGSPAVAAMMRVKP